MPTRKPQAPRHGQIKVATMKLNHAKKHLSMVVDSANEVRNYGGHDASGFSSQGALSPGGAAGADYQTSSVDTPDSDSMGATGY